MTNSPIPTSPRLTPAEAGIRAAATIDLSNPLGRMTGEVTHGDCQQVLRQLPDACADLVLTDPPYVTRYLDRSGRRIANDDNTRWMFPAFSEIYRVLKPDRYASCVRCVQMKHEQAYLLAKGNPLPPTNPPADVLPWHYTGNRLHPTQKPVSSLTPLIYAFSRPNDLVIDPFCGSGTTGVAARQCGRRFLLIEKDAAYHHTARERLM